MLQVNSSYISYLGASGYIGGYIIEKLLDKGYKVRGVVRDLTKAKFLKQFRQEEGQLELVVADINTGKYEEVVKGCDALIHTATPYIYTVDDPQVLFTLISLNLERHCRSRYKRNCRCY